MEMEWGKKDGRRGPCRRILRAPSRYRSLREMVKALQGNNRPGEKGGRQVRDEKDGTGEIVRHWTGQGPLGMLLTASVTCCLDRVAWTTEVSHKEPRQSPNTPAASWDHDKLRPRDGRGGN